jgi:hypothetical protein
MSATSIIVLVVGLALILSMAVMLFRVRRLPQQPCVYSRWRDWPVWLRAIGIFTWVDFFVFIYFAQKFGGDAWNGYSRGGQYFLGNKGGYTHVSRDVWIYSYYHVLLVWLSYAATFIGAAVVLNRRDNAKV